MFLIKNLEKVSAHSPFHELYQRLQNKYLELDKQMLSHLRNFQQEGGEPEYFNENEFKELYNNEKKEDRRRELEECLKTYKRKIIRKFQDLKLEISCED